METRKTVRAVIEEVRNLMEEKNYAEITIKTFSPYWNSLIEYADSEEEKYFTAELAERFLNWRYGISLYTESSSSDIPKWRIKLAIRSIDVLSEYSCTGKIKRKRSVQGPRTPDCFLSPTKHFLEHCKSRYNSDKTIEFKQRYINNFLIYLCNNHIEKIEQIDKECVLSYMKTKTGWSQRSFAEFLCVIRQYFDFLYQNNYINNDIAKLLPHPRHGRTGTLPNVWTEEQVQKLLAAVDRADPIGKRDYAILLLVTHLGLRDSDVQNLTFDNLYWKECCIRLVQTKTKRPLELPLDQMVGEAIIDYLKYGRPKQDKSQYVFVRHSAPYGKCTNYFHVMRKYLSAAGIPFDREKHHGLHTLRFTLATRLLEQEVPIETISEILGHSSVNTTRIYLQVDLEMLRQCALDPDELVGAENGLQK
ncbi:MAG: tyrosine-type recombinase/integrase [Firmicutes bacterium]|nr:tyrosine-type recombinase/integrase [Bacillota bacterium]